MKEEEEGGGRSLFDHTASQKTKGKFLWVGGVCRLFVRLFLQGTGSFSAGHSCISHLGIFSVKIEKVQHSRSPFQMFYSLQFFAVLKKRIKMPSQIAPRSEMGARTVTPRQETGWTMAAAKVLVTPTCSAAPAGLWRALSSAGPCRCPAQQQQSSRDGKPDPVLYSS